MNMLMRWLEDVKKINDAEKSVTFSEEAFNQLYEEALKLNVNRMVELKIATGKGMIIGATGVGLAWLGTIGVKKFKENKSKEDIIEEDRSPKEDWDERIKPRVEAALERNLI